jgi:hypothetical protein
MFTHVYVPGKVFEKGKVIPSADRFLELVGA